jgi:hypothetical protein
MLPCLWACVPWFVTAFVGYEEHPSVAESFTGKVQIKIITNASPRLYVHRI